MSDQFISTYKKLPGIGDRIRIKLRDGTIIENGIFDDDEDGAVLAFFDEEEKDPGYENKRIEAYLVEGWQLIEDFDSFAQAMNDMRPFDQPPASEEDDE